MKQCAQYLLFGQIGLFAFLIVCLLLNPHFLLESNEGGISNYGLYAKTIVPYTLAFGSAGIFTLLGARATPNRSLRIALYLLGFLFLSVLVSTYFYKINHAFDNIHEYTSAMLFIMELVLGSWFVLGMKRSSLAIIGLLIQYAGFTLSVLNDTHIIHKLFIAEVAASFGFSLLLIMRANSSSSGSPQPASKTKT
jgi:hypothetical protein